MSRNIKFVMLFVSAYLAICPNIEAQGAIINDSIDYILQEQMLKNIPHRKNQLKIDEKNIENG